MAEARRWAAYRNTRGSLNPGLRLEEGFARVLAAIYQAVGSKDAKADAFMPHVLGRFQGEAEEERLASPEEVLGLLKSVATTNNDSARALRLLQRRKDRRGSLPL